MYITNWNEVKLSTLQFESSVVKQLLISSISFQFLPSVKIYWPWFFKFYPFSDCVLRKQNLYYLETILHDEPERVNLLLYCIV